MAAHRQDGGRNILVPVVVFGALALALAGTPGTLAAWRDTESASGTVQAANFGVTLASGSASAAAPATLAVDATAAAQQLLPGASTVVPVTIQNTSTGGTRTQVLVTATAAPITPATGSAADAAFAGALSLALSAPTASTSCAGATGYQPAAGRTLTVDAGASQTWCAQLTLAAAAPNAAQGGRAVVRLALQADQVPTAATR